MRADEIVENEKSQNIRNRQRGKRKKVREARSREEGESWVYVCV